MEINKQPNVKTNFRGVDKAVMENFGKLSTKCRQSVATYFNQLEKSDVVDLFLTKENELALRTKKPLKILKNREILPEGAEIDFRWQPNFGVSKDNELVVRTALSGKDGYIFLDFGSTELAQKAYKKVELFGGDPYENKLPALGVLIDMAYKLEEPLQKIKDIAKNLIP